jgi:uncharacterized protein (DUF1684 family)
MKIFRIILCAIVLCGSLRALSLGAGADDSSYRQSVEKWRQDYENNLRSDDGWLTVSGLFWLHEGENRFGADPLNDIVLPGASVPREAGSFSFHNGKTVLHANQNATMTLNGKPVQTAELRADSSSDRVHLGDLTLYVHASGERYAIRVKDRNSKFRKGFTGLHWFPVDESYRLSARFIAYSPAKQVAIQNVLGDFDKVSIVGYVVFSLQGNEYRLDAEQDEPNSLFFVFRDLSSGKETYPAARFLDTDVPSNGSVTLDFNKAYNPPCAYNPYTTCPLPTPGNRLRVAIRAGEQNYNHEHEN